MPAYGPQRITPSWRINVVLTAEGASTASFSAMATATAYKPLRALRDQQQRRERDRAAGRAGWRHSRVRWLLTRTLAAGASITPATGDLLPRLPRSAPARHDPPGAAVCIFGDPASTGRHNRQRRPAIVRSYFPAICRCRLGWRVRDACGYHGTSPAAAYAAIPDQWLQGGRPACTRWLDLQGLRVTATWGYGPDVPSAIEQLTLELAVNIWRSRDKGRVQQDCRRGRWRRGCVRSPG